MNTNERHSDQKAHAHFWEERYRAASPKSSGDPGQLLCRLIEPLTPGRALELGCAKGDDVVWLARQGWSVVAVDISDTALDYAADNARRAKVETHITFERHDLAASFPEGQFDLVTASFLQSPMEFPRAAILRRAASAVASGGHLFIVEHGSRPPWSDVDVNVRFPTADETFASLALDQSIWTSIRVETLPRQATGPNGETATLYDNVIFLCRT